ncbi:MAG: alanine racemase [Elusimicrobiales bacterium]|nr:alanine racemase [Elusimicrobiales bacterium]
MVELLYRPTWAEISLSAIRKNLKKLKAMASPAELLFIVKANSYGHGASVLAGMAEREGLVSCFGVSSVEEGMALRRSGIKLPVLVLGSLYPFRTIIAAIKNNLIITVASPDMAAQLIQASDKLRRSVVCHLKLETGMGRIGARRPAAVKIYKMLSSAKYVKLAGMYTHFSSADYDPEYTRRQIRLFLEAKKELEMLGAKDLVCHASATSGLLNFPEARFGLVRPGIACYGLAEGFYPALTWKSRIVFIKNVREGAAISYGQTFIAEKPMRIATIPVGYADGYRRAFSNRASVLVSGRRCRVLGRVTMDMIMADITDVPGARIGSPVVLLGRQANEEITADELASYADTISYEIFTGISERVPRIFK